MGTLFCLLLYMQLHYDIQYGFLDKYINNIYFFITTYVEKKSCIDTEEEYTNGKASLQPKKRCLGKLTFIKA